MSPDVLPYGSWPSPVTPDDLVGSQGTPSDPRFDGGHVYHLGTTPESGSRMILFRRSADGTTTQLSPEWMSVRSRVHEYGGGAWAVRDGIVLAVDFATQRLWRLDGDEPRPVSPEVPDAAVRWSAMEIDPARGVVWVVREDHRDTSVEPVNELVRLPLEPDGSFGEVVVPGRRRALPRPEGDDAGDADLPDFVIDPVLSPSGRRIAWVQWSHPSMPWDDVSVMVADLDDAGAVLASRRVGGGSGHFAIEPVWVDDDRLAFIAEPEGWAVPFVVAADGSSEPVALAEQSSEYGGPAWVLRDRQMTRTPDGRLVATRHVDGFTRLTLVDPDRPGETTDLDLPLVAAAGLAPTDEGVVLDAGLTDRGFATIAVALPDDTSDDARLEVVHARGAAPDPAYTATPEAISWPGYQGQEAHGFLYRPTHPDVVGPDDELPPLMVVAHGGPTSATSAVPRPWTAYFTSRGIAVLDVNYSGSTGYGREYRNRLRGTWGLADIEDCVAGARHLADTGVVDGDRLGVRGGSAGGFVVLAALAFHDVFDAGVSYFGVADMTLLAEETHKFESRYLDLLVGPFPADRATYDARSPIHHVDGITAPLFLLQGEEDHVVPPSQATGMADALREQGRPVALAMFPGEGHGFREPAAVRRSAELETSFLAQVWGYRPADRPEQVEIENLGS